MNGRPYPRRFAVTRSTHAPRRAVNQIYRLNEKQTKESTKRSEILISGGDVKQFTRIGRHRNQFLPRLTRDRTTRDRLTSIRGGKKIPRRDHYRGWNRTNGRERVTLRGWVYANERKQSPTWSHAGEQRELKYESFCQSPHIYYTM